MKITDYRVKEGLAGLSVRYPCPQCGEALTSPVADAGAYDSCPTCELRFVVPGENERKDWERKQAEKDAFKKSEETSRREVEQQRRVQQTAKTLSRAASKADSEKHLQLDRDPLRGWYWQFALALALLALASGRHMVDAVTTDDTYLCVVIYALFTIGIVVNYLGVRQLRIEYVCAAACMETLKRPNGLGEVLSGLPAGVFQKHVQDLGTIAKYDENFTQDRLVTLLYSKLMARCRIVDILSNVLVSLGLIGTILGLITMTQGLNGTLESLSGSDNSSLLNGMRTTMSGLGTAFYTTLVGAMLGSVFLRILNNVYTSNVDHLVSYVASTAEVRIVPRLKQISRSRMEKAT